VKGLYVASASRRISVGSVPIKARNADGGTQGEQKLLAAGELNPTEVNGCRSGAKRNGERNERSGVKDTIAAVRNEEELQVV
jgi:hypothetical protein